jgi:hypothetical protein
MLPMKLTLLEPETTQRLDFKSVMKIVLFLLIFLIHLLFVFSSDRIKPAQNKSNSNTDIYFLNSQALTKVATPTKLIHEQKPKLSAQFSAHKIKKNLNSNNRISAEPHANTTQQSTELEQTEAQGEPENKLSIAMMKSNFLASEKNRKPSAIEALQLTQLKNTSIESKIERAAKNAQRSDCRNEYRSAGLLAAIRIAVDNANGNGCKW